MQDTISSPRENAMLHTWSVQSMNNKSGIHKKAAKCPANVHEIFHSYRTEGPHRTIIRALQGGPKAVRKYWRNLLLLAAWTSIAFKRAARRRPSGPITRPSGPATCFLFP